VPIAEIIYPGNIHRDSQTLALSADPASGNARIAKGDLLSKRPFVTVMGAGFRIRSKNR